MGIHKENERAMQKIAHCANFCIASFGVIHPPDRYRIPGVYTSMHGD